MQSELRPEDYLPLKREADAGRLRVIDVGASYAAHFLWFNLGARTAPGMAAGRRRSAAPCRTRSIATPSSAPCTWAPPRPRGAS